MPSGKATSLAAGGNILQQIMQMGEWRSTAMLRYIKEDQADYAAAFNIANCESDDGWFDDG